MNPTQQLLILGFVWPEPNSSGAGTRMLQLLCLFQEQGWQLTFACAAADGDFLFDVRTLGIDKVAISLNDASFDTFIRTLNPSMVLFDRFVVEEQFGWRVAEHCPNALRVMDTVDLHCLRLARQKAVREQREFKAEDLFSDTAKREIASILRCDISLLISETEKELLETHFKIDPRLLYYLPFLVAPLSEETVSNWPEFEARTDFIFIGNFLHEPNWDAVQFLKESVWPLVRKALPGVCLRIYGAYASQKVLQLHQPEQRFHIMGRAASAEAVVKNARIVLAPLRFGAGAKGKLIEAMQCGTPSVTTTIGAESMQGTLEWNGSIADGAGEIAQAAIQLYQDETLWRKAQQNGIKIVNERYSTPLFAPDFINHLLAVQERLHDHRLHNFFGALLQHHTLASTKYMSKWIEAKNKR